MYTFCGLFLKNDSCATATCVVCCFYFEIEFDLNEFIIGAIRPISLFL